MHPSIIVRSSPGRFAGVCIRNVETGSRPEPIALEPQPTQSETRVAKPTRGPSTIASSLYRLVQHCLGIGRPTSCAPLPSRCIERFTGELRSFMSQTRTVPSELPTTMLHSSPRPAEVGASSSSGQRYRERPTPPMNLRPICQMPDSLRKLPAAIRPDKRNTLPSSIIQSTEFVYRLHNRNQLPRSIPAGERRRIPRARKSRAGQR
jgi:hypothetical protein